MSKERELLRQAANALDPSTNKILIAQIETLISVDAEPAKEPEPVGKVIEVGGSLAAISTCNGTEIRLRLGDSVYTTPPDAAKRIAELESACKAHAELHEINEKRIFELKNAMGVVNGEYDLLRDCHNALTERITNGIRVTAVSHPSGFVGWMENAPTFDTADRTNAVLILDEEEE